MKKRFIAIITIVLCLTLLCACSGETRKGYTFETDFGDVFVVAVNTEGGYNMKKGGGHFTIVKDKKTILEGSMGTGDDWEKYSKAIDAGTVTKIEKTDSKLVWKDGSKIYSLTYAEGLSYVLTTSTISDDAPEDVIKDAISKLRIEISTERAGNSLRP